MSDPGLRQSVDAFIEAALPAAEDHRAGMDEMARKLLKDEPRIATASVYSAAMLGEVQAVETRLTSDPECATREGGPRGWPPLLYLCFSRFLRTDPERAERMEQVAERLLRAGADPNAFWVDSSGAEGNRESALYGAVGVANRPGLARLLIEAGADPNDGETPYHMVEHPGVPCAEIVFPKLDPLSRGIALTHQVDYEDLDGMRRLLELGADPNGPRPFVNAALHQAVFRGRGKPWYDLLMAHGADPNLRNRKGKTAYALAARAGRREIMGWLLEHGATSELAEEDRFLAACALADHETVQAMLDERPDRVDGLAEEDRTVICDAAAAGNTAGVRTMLDAGWDVNTRGTVWSETPLHRAAMEGRMETVELLLERGADLSLRDRSYHSSPLGWASHGNQPEVLTALLRDPSRLDLPDAVSYGSAERVLELLGDGDPDQGVGDGDPGVLLRAAAHGGHVELVRALLDRGAAPNLANREGLTALDYARKQGHAAVVELLCPEESNR